MNYNEHMSAQAAPQQSAAYEQALAAVIRQMPDERRAQVLDYAMYLLDIDRRRSWQEIKAILDAIQANTMGMPPDRLESEIDAAMAEVRGGAMA
jgi:hypothetical protein